MKKRPQHQWNNKKNIQIERRQYTLKQYSSTRLTSVSNLKYYLFES